MASPNGSRPPVPRGPARKHEAKQQQQQQQHHHHGQTAQQQHERAPASAPGPLPAGIGSGAHDPLGGGGALDADDLLYEYFPLSLDDWMPPVDAVYRPHVVHHTIVPPEVKAQQIPTLSPYPTFLMNHAHTVPLDTIYNKASHRITTRIAAAPWHACIADARTHTHDKKAP
ncbi:hypothetical protein VTH06DRAFT_7919 [Thermothelomyces fergusii]